MAAGDAGSVRAGTPFCSIAPPYLLADLAQRGSARQRALAARNLAVTAGSRAERATLTHLAQTMGAADADLDGLQGKRRTVYDAQHGNQLPGVRVRGENDPADADDSVNEAFDGSGTTYDFYDQIFHRRSVNDNDLELVSSVHYLEDFDNALWNGRQMIYGDGSGDLFIVGSLTKDIDVIAHELTHGVTQYTAGLVYHSQSGALNESFSDAFGSMVKQFSLGQTAAQADWLIGEGILVPALGAALRSMSAPGTAFHGDRQAADMDHYVVLPDDDDPHHDHGGVHINSGIPNRAFYLVATSLGGHSWEKAGQIWYDTLTSGLTPTSQFTDAARATATAAAKRYGQNSTEHQAVLDAWHEVKVT